MVAVLIQTWRWTFIFSDAYLNSKRERPPKGEKRFFGDKPIRSSVFANVLLLSRKIFDPDLNFMLFSWKPHYSCKLNSEYFCSFISGKSREIFLLNWRHLFPRNKLQLFFEGRRSFRGGVQTRHRGLVQGEDLQGPAGGFQVLHRQLIQDHRHWRSVTQYRTIKKKKYSFFSFWLNFNDLGLFVEESRAYYTVT